MIASQRLVVGAQPRGHARAEALDQNISVFDEAMQNGLAGGLFQVEHDTLLAAVAATEESAHALDQRRHLTGVVAGDGVFDLDDLRAQVTEQHGADGAGQKAGQVEDAGVVEGVHEGSLAWLVRAWQSSLASDTIRCVRRFRESIDQ